MKNSKKLRELLLEQLRKTPIIETACQKINISKMTLSRWRKASPKFASEVEEALMEGRLRINDIAESTILSLIAQGKLEPSKFWLTHNNPRYANKLKFSGKIIHKEAPQEAPLTAKQKAVARRALRLSLPQIYEQKIQK